jgi:flavin reductase (DIM6/NTAB) family NADH-FMN oxidoreductase RutF
VPSASVYHFFPNKEAALVALAHRHHEALEALSSLPSPTPLILPGSLTTLGCQMSADQEGGDHQIIIGRVLNIRLEEQTPLIDYRGSLRSLGEVIDPARTGAQG